MPEVPSFSINVIMKDEALGRFGLMTQRIRDLGFVVDHQDEDLGIMSGKLPSNKLAALRALDGIEAVEGNLGIQLPPPGFEIR